MNYEELETMLLPLLQQQLATRLLLSRRWNNVSLVTMKTYLEIKWFDPKFECDKPDEVFEARRIAPLNKTALIREIARQTEKLQQDIHAS
jgi:hypothetical protein